MFILLIDVDDDTRCVVFNDLSLHDRNQVLKCQKKYSITFSVFAVQHLRSGMSYITFNNVVMHILFRLNPPQPLRKTAHPTTTGKYQAPILESNKSNVGLVRALRSGNVKKTTIKAKNTKTISSSLVAISVDIGKQ
jgi:hypothetical protein